MTVQVPKKMQKQVSTAFRCHFSYWMVRDAIRGLTLIKACSFSEPFCENANVLLTFNWFSVGISPLI